MRRGWSRRRWSAPAAPKRRRSTRWSQRLLPGVKIAGRRRRRRARGRDHPRPSSRQQARAPGARRMIAKLRGLLDSFGADHAVIDVAGRRLSRLRLDADACRRWARSATRSCSTPRCRSSDDAIRLIGFASAEERDWFRLLTSVQGVGAGSRSRSCRRSPPTSCTARSPAATRRWSPARRASAPSSPSASSTS